MMSSSWWRVSNTPLPSSEEVDDVIRLHVNVNGRLITIFKYKGQISAIDAICHHAGGPLTLGKVQDIEDLSCTVVLCPWHQYAVTIDKGLKAYRGVEITGGKPVNTGWKLGKIVQRVHEVKETPSGVYIVSTGDLILISIIMVYCQYHTLNSCNYKLCVVDDAPNTVLE